MTTTVINLTPHAIRFRHRFNGAGEPDIVYPPSGRTAKVVRAVDTVPSPMPHGSAIQKTPFTITPEIPKPKQGTVYIVDTDCLPLCTGRTDIVAQATGQRDYAIRHADGSIEAITRWEVPGDFETTYECARRSHHSGVSA